MRPVFVALSILALSVAGAGKTSAQESGTPAFCRSGVGHPVHGRSWCIQKGFALGSTTMWSQTRWEDAVMRTVRRDGALSRSMLGEILGADVLGRLEDQRRRINGGASLSGRWLAAEEGGSVLQVFSGRTPVAELVDWDGNGRVDLVLLNSGLHDGAPRRTR